MAVDSMPGHIAPVAAATSPWSRPWTRRPSSSQTPPDHWISACMDATRTPPTAAIPGRPGPARHRPICDRALL